MCHRLFFPGKLCIKQPNAGLSLLQVYVCHILFQEDAPQCSFKMANPSGSQLGVVLSAGGTAGNDVWLSRPGRGVLLASRG